MSLIITIFALVFLTQLISWIGQSVLVELVGTLPDLDVRVNVTDATRRHIRSTSASSNRPQPRANESLRPRS